MGYYEENKSTYTVSVLGTEYEIYLNVPHKDDKMLDTCDGYCDWTVRRIVVADRHEAEQHADFEARKKVCLRHELIHAFLYESGLDQNTTWDIEGQIHPEQMVEWVARQYPKMLEMFRKVGAI